MILLVTTLLAAPLLEGPAIARWPSEVELEGFSVHADFDLQPYRHRLMELPKLRSDVLRRLQLPPQSEPIHVFLFARKSSYRSYLSRHFPGAPARQALYIKQRGPGMVFAHFHDDLEQDLRHEGVHAVLHSVLPMTPLWLDEGLAEYFEVEPSQRSSRPDYSAATRREKRWRGLPKLETLEALEDVATMGADDYRHAWQWAHFLLHGPPKVRDELLAYLRDIAHRIPPGSLSRRLRGVAPQLDLAFRRHWDGSPVRQSRPDP